MGTGMDGDSTAVALALQKPPVLDLGHLGFPGHQQGQELSTLVTGMDLKIKMRYTLLKGKSAEKVHLCFILSFQFKPDLLVFLACSQPSYSL